MKHFDKDPDALLDYIWDWTDWLENDDIISREFVVPTGLTLVSSIIDGSLIRAWFQGGTANKSYTVVCRITTNSGRIDDRSALFNVKER